MSVTANQVQQDLGKQAKLQDDWMQLKFNVKAVRSKFDTGGHLAELVKRWQRTFDYVKSLDDPEEQVRVLSTAPGELNVEKTDTPVQKDAKALWGEMVKLRSTALKQALDGLSKRLDQLEAQARNCNKTWRSPQPGAKPADLLHEIRHLEDALADERRMVARFKKEEKQAGGMVESVQREIDALKKLYVGLTPKRKGAGEPKPVKADGDTVLGAMTKKEFEDFEKGVIQALEALGATDPSVPLDPALLEQEVETIRKQLATADAKTPARDPEQELKDCDFTWETVKGRYQALRKEKKADEAKLYMERMCWFRRQVVDAKMLELQKKYGFHWGSVGSKNPESDYDISVKTHGKNAQGATVYDWQIVAEFNKDIAARFGKRQPGTIFDTNLYASAEVQGQGGHGDTAKVTSPDMQAMTEQGQDVGALMKMRRYMSWEEYLAFQEETLKGLEGDARKAMQRQFEEADDLYFMSVKQQLDRADERDGKKLPDPETAPDVTPGAQKKLLERLQALEHDGDKMMAINNELYVEAMGNVRKLEAALGKLKPGDKDYDGTLAALKSKQADAVFFAAEAYHSDGPFKHIVWADQAVKNDPKLKGKTEEQQKEIKRRLGEITLTQMLQSFNENLGDLLKDIGHYSEKDPFPGLGFIRSSKYLGRLCDAMLVLQDKAGQYDGEHGTKIKDALLGIKLGDQGPKAVKDMAEALTALRGGKVAFEEGNGVEDPVAEAQAYAVEKVRGVFGSSVSTLADLGTVVKRTAQQINAVLRAAVAAEKMKAKSGKEYFQAFGPDGEQPR